MVLMCEKKKSTLQTQEEDKQSGIESKSLHNVCVFVFSIIKLIFVCKHPAFSNGSNNNVLFLGKEI